MKLNRQFLPLFCSFTQFNISYRSIFAKCNFRIWFFNFFRCYIVRVFINIVSGACKYLKKKQFLLFNFFHFSFVLDLNSTLLYCSAMNQRYFSKLLAKVPNKLSCCTLRWYLFPKASLRQLFFSRSWCIQPTTRRYADKSPWRQNLFHISQSKE